MVCLGNICRSPAAEGIMRQKLLENGYQEEVDFVLDSAGTGSWHIGHPPDPRSQEVCERYGIDITALRARLLEVEDGKNYDYIFGMDYSNVDNIKNTIGVDYHDKVFMFDVHEVNDPYYSASDGFEIMYQHLEKASEVWIEKMFNKNT